MKENKAFFQFNKGHSKNNNNFFKANKNKSKQNPLSYQKINEQLKYIKTIEHHNKPIKNIILLDNMNYLTYDNNEFYITNLKEEKPKKENLGNNSIFNKILYSKGKIILSVDNNNQINGKDEKGITNKLYVINANNNNNLSDINTNDKFIDIIEIENVIITFGRKYIELFQFNPNNNQIAKASEIIYNETNDEKYQIICVERIDKLIICGHESGHISYWSITNEYPYLKNILLKKIHIGKINKIINDNDNIISCSSDKTIKIHSIEDNICLKVIDFEDEVIDIKKIVDLDNNFNYVISLRNGMLKVYNSEFKNSFNIPNPSNINKTRFVLNISISSDNNKNENSESFILITDDKKIELYQWNKKEEMKIELDKKIHNYKGKFNNNKKYCGKRY